MPIPLTYQAVRDRLLPELNQLMWEALPDYIGATGKYSWIDQIFHVNATDRLRHEFSSQESIGAWPVGTELSPYPLEEWELPQDLQVNLLPYKDSFLISDMLIKYGGPPEIHILPRLPDRVQNFVAGAMKSYNRRAGAIMLDVFAGTIMLGPDGLPIANNNHIHQGSAVVYDNLIPFQLSAAALDFAFNLNSVSDLADSHGDPLDIQFDTLLIGRPNRRNAFDIVNNTVLPGAFNDQQNYWHGAIKNIIEVPWWKNSLGSGQWWGLLDSSQHSLTGLVAEPPTLTVREGTGGPDTIQFYGRCIFEFFFKSWEGTAWSNGSQPIT